MFTIWPSKQNNLRYQSLEFIFRMLKNILEFQKKRSSKEEQKHTFFKLFKLIEVGRTVINLHSVLLLVVQQRGISLVWPNNNGFRVLLNEGGTLKTCSSIVDHTKVTPHHLVQCYRVYRGTIPLWTRSAVLEDCPAKRAFCFSRRLCLRRFFEELLMTF